VSAAALPMPVKMGRPATDRQGLRDGCASPDDRTFREKVRDAIARRCPGGERCTPEAHEIEADLIVALHSELNGCAEATRGHRSADYWRKALRGEDHPPTTCDLARVADEKPLAIVAACNVLLSRAGYVAVPDDAVPIDIHEATAKSGEAHARTVSAVLRAVSDGEITEAEDAEIEHAIALEERKLAGLRAAKNAARRRGMVSRG
jgi:hypothetical protein